MIYLKSYLIALFKMGGTVGFVYLLGSFLFGDDPKTLPLVYIATVSSLAGPIGVWLEKKENV